MLDAAKWLKAWPVIAGTVATVVLLAALLTSEPMTLSWGKAIALLFIAIFVFALVATMRYGLGGLAEPAAPHPGLDGQAVVRSRLAPLVIGIGTVGILVMALGVLLALALAAGEVSPETYIGVFSTVVPVFATWVGAVIAFYFTNESYRQAAQASGALRDPELTEPITGRMVPLDKITGLTLGGTSREKPVPEELKRIDMVELVYPLFGETISRVIIFDKDKRVVAIVRQKLAGALGRYKTVADYLAEDQHQADAVNFQAVPEQASVAQARAIVETFRTGDLFVTQHGRLDQPVKGWVSDDRLSQ